MGRTFCLSLSLSPGIKSALTEASGIKFKKEAKNKRMAVTMMTMITGLLANERLTGAAPPLSLSVSFHSSLYVSVRVIRRGSVAAAAAAAAAAAVAAATAAAVCV